MPFDERYRNDPKFSDRQVWADTVDPDQTAPRGSQTADQGLHCLPFCQHLLGALFYLVWGWTNVLQVCYLKCNGCWCVIRILLTISDTTT